ncbi:30S ribosomal protein S17 [Enterobacteriaceae endosymbiont of Neohaemonia nigricornis]|uniref:30S ribosomal protein S17 n=1 Tax=Enterobacteriaceae endosymbiont of Neohaemonia nigricornis TaxID=2675792 RepID=UPI001449E87E|nr:30S ribosomal protein S17 [Enterobacteriaceae endosymbiont of Neohaemonia nigricornis]QJC30461.1 30S ribosomal protein S17 [Enterobacteriaceae endosymbiont of Neohaemonia nigricornis]
MNTNVRTLKGTVISNKMNKTIVVKINRLIKHPIYGKFINRTTKLHVHDANNICHIGDIVEIKECKPYSKTKAWTLVNIINQSII